MQRRMQRSKRRRQPQIPRPGLVKTIAGEALVFLSPTLLPELSEATELQADATFRTVPGLFKQLFTIHITRGHLAFPFAYILMTRKSRILYDAVLEKVIDIFDELHPERYISVDLIMSDYEAAIQGSMAAAFHGSQHVGCFFHYSQAIWRRIQKYGLQFAYTNRAVIAKYNIKAYYHDVLRRESAVIQAGIKQLNNYFLSYWIGEITPQVFSVFGLVNRTNNLVESWHRWLNDRMGKSHLNVWDFICKWGGSIFMREFLKKSRYLTEPDLITQNQADSTERATVQPRRRFLAGTVRAPQINHASPTVEPADNDNDPSAEAEITPVTSRPRRIVHVPRHLSADGDSPITPPSRRCTRRRQ
ncbi:hypothetical protein GHT06_009097 [Daphnia sinensis]|uniref:MULE transposase domain-containing protein n=1 Tax=Daphnia sinensis TaxID=1820382 RepID=A0AAD5LWE6_9CRUS|nr:hypothetical protein GHT06_009097 [Daphnia sinensis]